MPKGSNAGASGCAEYAELSRRRFMARSAAAAAIAAVTPAWLPRVSFARDYRSSQRDVVLSIFLRGAADGLSICPPHGDSYYYANRPTQAIPRPDSGSANRAINLDGYFGLAAPLAPLMPAYQNGHLLIVHAAGSTDPTRSHFDAQHFMEVGRADDISLGTGWLGRHLASIAPAQQGALLRGVGIADGLQLTLLGAPRTLPISDLDGFGLSGNAQTTDIRTAAIRDMYMSAANPLRTSGINTLSTVTLLDQINFAGYVPAGGAQYPSGDFGNSLKATAALVRAQVGIEAVAIDSVGWDTHAGQGTLSGTLSVLMSNLAAGLAAFYTDVIANDGPGVTIVCMSEFGRRLEENSSQGTDHGHGNAMLVLGRCIAGGRVLTQWPGLAPENLFEGMDLDVTIDYRDVLAEIVQRRLGNGQLETVFPGYSPLFRGVTSC